MFAHQNEISDFHRSEVAGSAGHNSNASSTPAKMASQQNDTLFQVGLINAPAIVLSHGSQFDDASKNTKSTRLLVVDERTITLLQQRESAVQITFPNLTMKSCIGEQMVHPVTGVVGSVVRIKMTKNARCYRKHDANPASAGTLDELAAGHTIVLQCRSVHWTYKDTCGITAYGNLVRGLGAVDLVAWGSAGQSEGASSTVEWK
jgi:hypothetical protein